MFRVGTYGGLNTYAYVKGNPVVFVDRDGRIAVAIVGAAVVAATIYGGLRFQNSCNQDCVFKCGGLARCGDSEGVLSEAVRNSCLNKCAAGCALPQILTSLLKAPFGFPPRVSR
jgi:hypothetical protein